MKIAIATFVCVVAMGMAFGQNAAEGRDFTAQNMTEKMLAEGIRSFDAGDFETARNQFETILQYLPKDYQTNVEMAMLNATLGEFEAAATRAKSILADHVEAENLDLVYLILGNALDGMDASEDAIVAYNKGIALNATNHQLYFNRGVAFVKAKDKKAALDSFCKAVAANPRHASSHNAIAMLEMEQNSVASLMASLRCITLEPVGKRAAAHLEKVEHTIHAEGAVSKHAGKIDIVLDNTDVQEGFSENDFSTQKLLFALHATQDLSGANKRAKANAPAEFMAHKMTLFAKLLEEELDDQSGFYWTFYAPYFVDLQKSGHVATLCHLVAAANPKNKSEVKWLEDHKEAVYAFYQWDDAYWD